MSMNLPTVANGRLIELLAPELNVGHRFYNADDKLVSVKTVSELDGIVYVSTFQGEFMEFHSSAVVTILTNDEK